MAKIVSSGIVLTRGSGPTLQILLGHASHKNPASYADRRWTFFKGKQENGESLWETAKREFYEEAGMEIKDKDFSSVAYLNGEPAPFFSYKVKTDAGKKTVFAHLLFDVKKLSTGFPFECKSFVAKNYPEIDDYTWATPVQARRICMPSQQELFDHILELSYFL